MCEQWVNNGSINQGVENWKGEKMGIKKRRGERVKEKRSFKIIVGAVTPKGCVAAYPKKLINQKKVHNYW